MNENPTPSVNPGHCVACGQPVAGQCENPGCGIAQAGKRDRR